MFGYNYHFTTNPEKGTIKLSPTMGTYAKAFAPALVIWCGLGVLVAASKFQEKRTLTQDVKTHETD